MAAGAFDVGTRFLHLLGEVHLLIDRFRARGCFGLLLHFGIGGLLRHLLSLLRSGFGGFLRSLGGFFLGGILSGFRCGGGFLRGVVQFARGFVQ